MSEFGAQVDLAVFPNNHKKGEKHPDHRGSFVMTKALLKEMVELVKKDEEVHVSVALWERKAQGSGNPYMFGRMSIDSWKVNKERESGGQEEKEGATEFEEDDLFE